MAQLFGFSIKRKEGPKGQSPIPPSQDDSITTIAGGYFGQYVDLDGGASSRNEYELIRRYRDMALHPEVDTAIDEVVNEAIISDLDDTPVQIELSNLEVGDNIKTKIREEFENVKRLLDFDRKSHEIFRRWYIDGRLHYHKVIDLNSPKLGITELRYIDPLKIKRVREIRKNDKDPNAARRANGGSEPSALDYDFGNHDEYYIYNPKGFLNMNGPEQKGIRIAMDAIAHTNSGLMDLNQKIGLSFLHKAIKSLNQLRMIEDALVIYRLSRAPERRIFYIDVGNLPKVKAEQYLRDVMNRYRNKLVYDANTGEIRDDKKHMSMLEDFWLPRREGGRGTEISTLPGGQNLGELKDVEYFRTKLFKSLNLPPSRLDGEKGFSLGRSNEILRDELKFGKFVGRLRKKFSILFDDLLKTQSVLKRVISVEEWEDMREHIQYDFLFDNHFQELKDAELNNNRMDLAVKMEPYLGRYFSTEYIKKQVLQQSDQERKEIEIQIKAERAAGIIPSVVPIDAVLPENQPDLGSASSSDLDSEIILFWSLNNGKHDSRSFRTSGS